MGAVGDSWLGAIADRLHCYERPTDDTAYSGCGD